MLLLAGPRSKSKSGVWTAGARCGVPTPVLKQPSEDFEPVLCSQHLNELKMVNLGDIIPNFEAETTEGKIKFHDWLGDSWGILFSHPQDFTPVCTSELGRAATLAPEFTKRSCKIIGLTCDPVNNHISWIEDIKAYTKLSDFPFPIIADDKRAVAVELGMIAPDEQASDGMPLTCRAVFIIGPDKKLKLSMLYPVTTGRNFDEIIRALDSLQVTSQQKVATPADWKVGTPCMVIPSLSAEEAKKLFPDHIQHSVPSGKPYLRTTM
ncbi:Peroxiredoxin C-terminal [Trinorchestia longiramus]|nr:Peroxiredoxin C-terminal [Trinorchestia longiramus]